MLTVYSEDHALQDGKAELVDGQLVPCFEMPRRAFLIRDRVLEVGLGAIVPPRAVRPGAARARARARLRRVPGDGLGALDGHRPRLRCAAMDVADPASAPGPPRADRRADGLLQLRCRHADHRRHLACGAGQRRRRPDRRPSCWPTAASPPSSPCAGRPGHHAAADLYGGYCFLNNAAIAAQYLIDGGAERVAILDVDYHHGNGTQAIFYDRADVLFLSLHGDPREEYPFFLGWAEERGAGRRRGLQRQLSAALGHGLPGLGRSAGGCLRAGRRLRAGRAAGVAGRRHLQGRPDLQVPAGERRLHHLRRAGSRRLGLPTLFVMEGGYAVEQIGINAVNVLQGFEGWRVIGP